MFAVGEQTETKEEKIQLVRGDENDVPQTMATSDEHIELAGGRPSRVLVV